MVEVPHFLLEYKFSVTFYNFMERDIYPSVYQ